MDIVFFIVCEKYIFLVLSKLGSKGILNMPKKGIASAMECADLAAFTFAMPEDSDLKYYRYCFFWNYGV